jgi:photosystem II stability/assembly factor-like uncharacterized protein
VQIIRALSRNVYSISPLLPFYLLGLQPGQVLWPAIFLPAILGVSFVWALILATALVVMLGETENVGQRILVRYAAWATVSGLIINLGHDMTLVWLSQRVDFLLEQQPWRLLGGSYAVACGLLFAYHLALSWGYLRLRFWQSALFGLAFAILTAPWTTLVTVNFGQGRLPLAAQRPLWAGVVFAALAVLLISIATTLLRRRSGARRLGRVLILTCLAVLAGAGGARLWTDAVLTPAVGVVSASSAMGDLVFSTRARVYALPSSTTQVRSLGSLNGQVIAVSPNGRWVLTNEQKSDGTTTVTLIPTTGGANQTLGIGQASGGAWSPDSGSLVYVTPTETSGQIHLVRSDGGGDRVLAEGRSPSFSPDGRRIAYAARTAGRWQVWAMLPTGGDAIQLTTDGGEDPVWSPDGRYIAYIQNNRVHVMDADGGNKRRLPVDSAFADMRPLLVWCTDGARLAYVYIYPPESGRPTQIYIWETTTPAIPLTGALAPLTTPTPAASRGTNYSGDYRAPFAWSTDSVWFGFVRKGDLWVLNVRNGEEKRLAPADSFAWGGRSPTLVVRPVPTYPPTPTPTALPPTVVESPAILVLDPRDPATIYAGTATGLIRKVGAGGWFMSSQGIDGPTRVRTLAFDPSDSSVVFAGTDGQRAVGGALYKSVDGGNRWTATTLKDLDVYQVIVHPRQPRTIYAGTSKGFYVSTDSGATWGQRNNGLKTTMAVALALDPAPAATRGTPATPDGALYLGTRQGEVYKSLNEGLDWRLVQTLNAPVTGLVVYTRRAGAVFAATEDGLFASADAGDTWNQVSGGIWKVRLDGLVVAPKDNTLYAYGVQGVYVSHDGGTNWGPASTGLEGTQPSALVAHPTDPSLLYVGTDKGVFRTSNGGVTWLR